MICGEWGFFVTGFPLSRTILYMDLEGGVVLGVVEEGARVQIMCINSGFKIKNRYD